MNEFEVKDNTGTAAFVQSGPMADTAAYFRQLLLDAERYRWLRQMIFDDRIIVAPDRMLHGEELDSAIDAAMQQATDSTTTKNA